MDITYSGSDPNVEDGWNLDEVHRQAFYGEVEGGMGVVGEGSGCGSEDQFREEGVISGVDGELLQLHESDGEDEDDSLDTDEQVAEAMNRIQTSDIPLEHRLDDERFVKEFLEKQCSCAKWGGLHCSDQFSPWVSFLHAVAPLPSPHRS